MCWIRMNEVCKKLMRVWIVQMWHKQHFIVFVRNSVNYVLCFSSFSSTNLDWISLVRINLTTLFIFPKNNSLNSFSPTSSWHAHKHFHIYHNFNYYKNSKCWCLHNNSIMFYRHAYLWDGYYPTKASTSADGEVDQDASSASGCTVYDCCVESSQAQEPITPSPVASNSSTSSSPTSSKAPGIQIMHQILVSVVLFFLIYFMVPMLQNILHFKLHCNCINDEYNFQNDDNHSIAAKHILRTTCVQFQYISNTFNAFICLLIKLTWHNIKKFCI